MTLFSNSEAHPEVVINLKATSFAPPNMVLDPEPGDGPEFEIPEEDPMFTGETVDFMINVSNTGEADLRFEVEVEETMFANEEQRDDAVRTARRVGPRADVGRDDPGDMIAQINNINVVNQYVHPGGWDQDNNWMWMTNYSPQWIRAYSWDNDYNLELQVEVNNVGNMMDGAWFKGFFIVHASLGNSLVNFYDEEGQLAGNHQFGHNVYGLAADNDQNLLFVQESGNNYAIHVYEISDDAEVGEQIGLINNHLPFHGNQYNYGIEWVASHSDGKLWITNYSNQRVYQIAVDEDEWQATETIQDFQVGGNQPYDPVAHDGVNIWAGGYNEATIRIYDDGISETAWIAVYEGDIREIEDPEEWTRATSEYTVAGDESMDFTLHLDAAGLFSGRYAADIHFISNDPTEGEGDQIIDVEVYVQGIAVFGEVIPAEDENDIFGTGVMNNGVIDFGYYYDDEYTDEEDNNTYLHQLYTGIAYPLPVTFTNIGTAEGTILEVISNSDQFWAEDLEGNDVLDVIMPPEDEVTINFMFMADAEEADGYMGTLVLITDIPDPDGGEVELEVDVYARPVAPPEMVIDPVEIFIDEIFEGDQDVVQLNIANDADGNDNDEPVLHWWADIEVVENDNRDDAVRTARRVGPRAAAKRDDAGDLLAEIQNINQANQYNHPHAWDQDNDRMWVAGYSPAWLRAYTYDDDYENLEAEVDIANHANTMDGAWFKGFYMHHSSLGNTIVVFRDENGDVVSQHQFNHNVYGLAADNEENWLFVQESGNNYAIHVYEISDDGEVGEQIGLINNHLPFHGNTYNYGIEWVPSHPDGKLWITNYSTQRLYQIAVDEDEWQATETILDFPCGATQPYDVAAHDGENMWVGGYGASTIRVYDDGNAEVRWIAMGKMEGILLPGDDEFIDVIFNTMGLVGGEYEATIYIWSNDPLEPEQMPWMHDASPDAIVGAIITVVGIPRIDVTEGGPEEDEAPLDWANSDWGVGYVDFPDPMWVEVANVGTEPLHIEGIESDNDAFYVDPDDIPEEIAIEEVIMLKVWFAAEEEGEYEGTLSFFTDDPNWEDGYPVRVMGIALLAPEMIVDPQAIEDYVDDNALRNGQSEDVVINIANDGDQGADNLYWWSKFETIAEPERDVQVGRTARRVGPQANVAAAAGAGVSSTLMLENSAMPESADPNYVPPSNNSRSGRNVGPVANPRRDDPPEGRFLLVFESAPWGYNLQTIFQNVEDLDYERFNNWGQDFDVNDFDYMWVGNYQADAWNAAYNDRFEEVEEWVAGGGVYYMCTGTNNYGVVPMHPGGLTRTQGGNTNDGRTAVGPDECYLFELMEWERNTSLAGNSYNHTHYTENDLADIEDSDEFQILTRTNNPDDGLPVTVRYTYGRGQCIVSGTTDGYLHNNPEQYIWGAAGEELLYYMESLAGSAWITWEPTENMDPGIEPGDDENVVVTLTGGDLDAGRYEGEIHFFSNDPRNPEWMDRPDMTDDDMADAIIPVIVDIVGAAAIAFGDPVNPDNNTLMFEAANPEVDPIYVDGMYTIMVEIENPGTEHLDITAITLDDDVNFTFDFGDYENEEVDVPRRESRMISISYTPTETGEHETLITFESNAENVDDGIIELILLGAEAFLPPVMTLDYDELHAFQLVNDGEREYTLSIGNDADDEGADLVYSISAAMLEMEEEQRDGLQRSARRVGPVAAPVRDDINLDGLMFAVFQTNSVWGWLDDGLRQDPLLDGNNVISYRQVNDLNNVDFEEYDVVCFSSYSQQYNQQYANNLDRLEEYVAGGGAVYYETGNTNAAIRSPGGIYNDINGGASNGQLIVSPDPDDDDYSLLAELAHGEQNQYWNRGEIIEGSSWLHSTYSARQFDDALDDGVISWYQPIASVQGNVNSWGAVAYGFGHGAVLTVGHPSAHCWFNYNQDGMWGSIGAEILLYLTEVSESVPWIISIDPEEGRIEPGSSQDVLFTVDAVEMEDDMEYFAEVIIESNDPNDGEVHIPFTLHTFIDVPWDDPVNGGSNHSLIITGVAYEDEAVQAGWSVGVFDPDDVCTAIGRWLGEDLGLGVYGDDPDTEADEGFEPAQALAFRLWDPYSRTEVTTVAADFAEGPRNWVDQGFSVVSLNGLSAEQIVVDLPSGWNLISINVSPGEEFYGNDDRGPAIRPMMAQLFDAENDIHRVFLMKDEDGNFYAPHIRDFNNIPYWNLEQGYQVRIRDNMGTEATWSGSPIANDAALQVDPGWNMIAYYPRYELPMAVSDRDNIDDEGNFYAIMEIKHDFRIMKDYAGNFAANTGRFLFSNMPPLRMTQGYQINITAEEPVVLHYSPQQDAAAMVTVPRETVEGHWTAPARTPANMSVLIESINGVTLSAGDQVAAFNTEGILVGVGNVTDAASGMVGMAVWGDDINTNAREGLIDNEAFTLRLWDADKEIETTLVSVNVTNGKDLTYSADDLVSLNMAVESAVVPENFYLAQAYPNPFNAVTRIAYGLPEGADVSVKVFDVAGRHVATLVSGAQEAGHHVAVWNGRATASGIYLIKMEASNFNAVSKITLVK
jgi:hypothetical protein